MKALLFLFTSLLSVICYASGYLNSPVGLPMLQGIPSFVSGSGAGSSPTISVSGNNSFLITTVTIGSGAIGSSSPVIVFTTSQRAPTNIVPICQNQTLLGSGIGANAWSFVGTSNNTWEMRSPFSSTGLLSGNTYTFACHVGYY
jgi:hypothetical protein